MSAPKAFVVGHPIAHSRSPMLHGYWLNSLGILGSYERCDVLPEDLPVFLGSLKANGYVGGNITVPHKTAAMSLVAHIDAAGQAIGAINTVWFEGDVLHGGNTDALGFIGNLDEKCPSWQVSAKTALILGAGGAARAAIFALLARGLHIILANRTREKAKQLADYFGSKVEAHGFEDLPKLLPQADLLVNTTALGMQGKDPLVLDLAPLKPSCVIYDVVYVPLETDLLKQARLRGHHTVDGLGMLLHQAVQGFHHWFGQIPKVTPELRALLEADITGQR